MKKRVIYLAYKTEPWLTYNSRKLVYIGESLEDVIAQLQAHSGMTEEQAEQVRRNNQSQCNGTGYEWDIDKQYINAFTD